MMFFVRVARQNQDVLWQVWWTSPVGFIMPNI